VDDEGQVSQGEPAVETFHPLPFAPVATRTVVLNGLADSASVLVITFGVAAAGGLLWSFARAIRGGATQRPAVSVWLLALATGAQEIFFAYFAWRRFRKNREDGRVPIILGGERLSAVLLGIPCGMLLMGVGGLIAKLVGGTAPRGIVELFAGLLHNSWIAASVFFVIAVLAPVCEEYFFRGAIFGLASANANPWAGAIVASILFATLHFNFRMVPYYLVFSAMNCWLLFKTKTLAAPIAAHITVNASACIFILMAPRLHP
jgi:membrane protease YdiL (CAAX protease family)